MTSAKSKENRSSKQLISDVGKIPSSDKSGSEHEQENLKSILSNLLTKSSVYAVAQLVTSSGCGRKLLWFFVLLVGVLGCSYEVYRFLTLYFQYPVVITLEVKNNWKLDFPAVTICNLNRIPIFYYDCLYRNKTVEECLNFCLDKGKPAYEPIRPILASERQRHVTCSSNFDGVFSEQRTESLLFMNRYLNLSKEDRRKLGHQANSFITSCTFNGESCSVSNFSDHSSIEFGNCFTFNGRNETNTEVLQTSYIGPNSGLDITLNLEVPDYSPITSSIGARIVVHEANAQPEPEDYGFNINPGFETSVAIQQISMHRLPHPYRDRCYSYEGQSLRFPRNQEDCIRKCIQSRNLHQCGCKDPFLPSAYSSNLCDLLNKTSVCCLEEVMKSLSKGDTPCPCPLPCESTRFEMTISAAEWPARSYYNAFMKDEEIPLPSPCENMIRVEKTDFTDHNDSFSGSNFLPFLRSSFNMLNQKRNCINMCVDEEKQEYLSKKSQIAKLKVFYKTLEKSSYIQEPMFQESELFSQLGGQLGLWLGISLVALFECIENISHLLHYFIKRSGLTKQNVRNYHSSSEKITRV
ncbi:FMRFamide-activated amiloride-sensitive sodium channel [Nephila pilipes]|uniref:FMRFamide-activated amiloride-sensitive sodium channel n=1 Tax=Nephila pilipes TaxID=299642 RepID=A0A8X6TWU9_NEPPI|nr:FMRFamide-activated amiloride-sensitive sodium channel [Nephila pilipes]